MCRHCAEQLWFRGLNGIGPQGGNRRKKRAECEDDGVTDNVFEISPSSRQIVSEPFKMVVDCSLPGPLGLRRSDVLGPVEIESFDAGCSVGGSKRGALNFGIGIVALRERDSVLLLDTPELPLAAESSKDCCLWELLAR